MILHSFYWVFSEEICFRLLQKHFPKNEKVLIVVRLTRTIVATLYSKKQQIKGQAFQFL